MTSPDSATIRTPPASYAPEATYVERSLWAESREDNARALKLAIEFAHEIDCPDCGGPLNACPCGGSFTVGGGDVDSILIGGAL